MSAPPNQHDSIYAEWGRCLDSVNKQLYNSYTHRQVFQAVRDALTERAPDDDGTFLVSYADVYWDSQVMVVRRLADDSESNRPDSLWWLMERIRRNHRVLTRERYLELRIYPEMESHTGDFDQLACGGGHIDPDLVSRWQREIEPIAQVVTEHADTYIAHRDPQRPLNTTDLTFGVIHGTIDSLAEIANRVNGLLTDRHVMFRPVLSATWKVPLTKPIFATSWQ